jgi:Fic family protein
MHLHKNRALLDPSEGRPMPDLRPLEQLQATRFDQPAILKKLATSSRRLAELKGVAASIPNQGILINSLGLQEAKDSSAIENIVTTHDELFRDDVDPDAFANPAAKEVLRYRQALRIGFEQVRATGLLTANHIATIQGELERNNAGFRKLPGTALKDGAGRTVYMPPQDPAAIVALMRDLERFINEPDLMDLDPLIKMATSSRASTPSTTAMDARGASSTCCTSSRRACSTSRCCT